MNTRIKTLLVDDERKSREVMSELLTNFFKEIEIVGEANSVDDAFLKIEQLKPQLVFLDIQMPKASGFELLKKYDEVPFKVVFVTSFDRYAITAIKFSALDYLLKPIEIEDLRGAIEKVKNQLNKEEVKGNQIINLIHNIEHRFENQRITVHEGESVVIINTEDIVYIQSEGRYCYIFEHNGNKHTVAKYLKDFETFFDSNKNFIRIHKEYIINVKYIKSYSKGEPCFITLANNLSFEVSRRKKQEVLEKLKM